MRLFAGALLAMSLLSAATSAYAQTDVEKRLDDLERRIRALEASPQPRHDAAFEKQLREQSALEERQLAATRSLDVAQWTDKIRAKIRGNVILPRDIPGNPEAVFDVAILPTGEVLTVRKRKSSGHAAYDDAVERAISKSSPLPLPDDRSVFRRDLEIKLRPQDR